MVALQQISIFPIKSSSGIDISSSWVDSIGIPYDRRFVVCDANGQFITARTVPKLCLIQANLTPQGLIITAPDMPLIQVNYQQCLDQYQHVTVWGDTILGQRCHDSVDAWFSQFVGQPCHLLFFGEQSSRQVINSDNPVAFADGYPLLLIAQSSLDDLNSKLARPVTMKQFRPNLIVSGCEPFAEDSWRHIRIGAVEFELTKPCSRCIFTTVDPITAKKHPEQEPLTTLKSYRQVDTGDVMFGQNLIPLNQGQIHIGNKVPVLYQQTPPMFNLKSKNASKEVKKEYHLICKHIYDETHDVKTFIFHNDSDDFPQYVAGQHLPFQLTIAGKKVHAIYTLSSSPTRPNTLAITVKRVPNGKVSNYLHDQFSVGDSIIAEPPSGNFTLQTIRKNKVLLLSAGSGITPMLSILKAFTDNTTKNEITFFHSARSEKDLIALDEISALARKHGNCQIRYTLTQQASQHWTGYQGRLSKQMLTNIPHLTDHEVMVCGPQQFREQAKQLLTALGLPETQFHFESFGNKLLSNEPLTKSLPKNVSLDFNSWDKQVKGNSKETILEQGEAAGLILPFSCRGGMCGRCKVKLDSGEVKQLATDGLLPEEKEQSYILACSSVPISDVVISKPNK